jgi:hypothetical protein
MQDSVYGLPRIPLLGTSVNKGKKKGQDCHPPSPEIGAQRVLEGGFHEGLALLRVLPLGLFLLKRYPAKNSV